MILTPCRCVSISHPALWAPLAEGNKRMITIAEKWWYSQHRCVYTKFYYYSYQWTRNTSITIDCVSKSSKLFCVFWIYGLWYNHYIKYARPNSKRTQYYEHFWCIFTISRIIYNTCNTIREIFLHDIAYCSLNIQLAERVLII